jgi:hypothetical protein
MSDSSLRKKNASIYISTLPFPAIELNLKKASRPKDSNNTRNRYFPLE